MKILTFISFILISLQSFSQTTYNKGYYFVGDSASTFNEIQSVAELENGYIISNLVAGTSINQSIQLIKIDVDGNYLNDFLITDSIHDYVLYLSNNLLIDNDSQIVIVTSVLYNNQLSPNSYIIKLNQNLDTIWTKTIPLPDTLAGCSIGNDPLDYFTAIRQTQDSGYIIAGNYAYQCNNANQRAFLTKLV